MASHCPESNDAKTRGSLGTGATVQGERIAMTTTVLIADDNAAGRQALQRVLYTIPNVIVTAEAGDGEEAVRLALEHFFAQSISQLHLESAS
jgi:response regulator RpfG family c-di-GMP phosphodiesterase